MSFIISVPIDLMGFQKQPPEVFYKKGFLNISQNEQKNTCIRVSFLM